MRQNTKRLYSLIFAMLFLVCAFVVYFDLIIPAYTDLQTSKGNLIGEQNLLTNEKQIVAQIQTLLTTYQSQSAEVQTVNAALPVGPHLADAMAQLYGIAGANSMTMSNIGINEQVIPAADIASQGAIAGAATTGQIVRPVGTITFSLSVTGTYENFKSFVMALEDNMRFFDIGSIAIQPVISNGKTTSDLFNFSLSATTYYQSQ